MEKITKPALLVDEEKCRKNIRIMAEKAKKNGIVFRPHFKTHQSHVVGNWFRDFGVDKIAVSSLGMAEFFAQDHWRDIMVAFPVNVREMESINSLASQIKLGIVISDSEALAFLQAGLHEKLDFYIKIDVGSHRTGFDATATELLGELLAEATANAYLTFRGFVAHAGHSYQTQSLNEVHKIYHTGVDQLEVLKDAFIQDYPGLLISWGDTPTCSLMEEFEGVDEIRPGNFVFYDLCQYHLGSCDWEQIAVVVAAPVVAKHRERQEVVLYAGTVHLSKDHCQIHNSSNIYGEVILFSEKGWKRFSKPIYMDRLSQEHSILCCPEEYWDCFHVGDLVGIVPVHSCLTANLMKEFHDTDGNLLV